MDFASLKTVEFLELLASDAPAPGGGAAAAIAGSMGASLIGMVASLTKGKEKYKEYEGFIEKIAQKAEDLRSRLNGAANRDAEAFGLVSTAYKMKRDTAAEKKMRAEAIESALKKAAEAPLELMALVFDSVELCNEAVGKSNVNVASDLSVSAVLLRAAAQGAYINVLVNLSGIGDEDFVSEYKQKSSELLKKTENMTAEILSCIKL